MRVEQGRGGFEPMDTSRDGSTSPRSDGLKSSAREQEAMSIRSPGDVQEAERSFYNAKSSYPQAMDTDSPSSYPKHVIVPSPPDYPDKSRQLAQKASPGSRPSGSSRFGRPADNVVTPVSTREAPPVSPYYDRLVYRAPAPLYYPNDIHGYPAPPYYPNDIHGYYAPHGHYSPMNMDMERSYAMAPNVQLRPKRWACDYCNVACFLTYEEACAHEEACATRHHATLSSSNPGFAPEAPQMYPGFAPEAPQMYNSGLGALFHAARREVQHGWGGGPAGSEGGPSSVIIPRYQKFRRTEREGRDGVDPSQKRMLLAMPNDNDSLSDRQCFVRTDFVEVFEATEKDVASRHSKGAQKLAVGQVGIRCIHCSHLRTKDRAERAVCYPSSISRIYQTVADMQRFHFEQCREIPEETRKIYKSLKTTRPRGVGSPQGYWIESAKCLNLVDSEDGIRFSSEGKSS